MTARQRDYLKHALNISAGIAALWGGILFISRVSASVAYAQSSAVRVDSLQTRVNALEHALVPLSYMTCVSFAETHSPEQVPSYCDQFTRPK